MNKKETFTIGVGSMNNNRSKLFVNSTIVRMVAGACLGVIAMLGAIQPSIAGHLPPESNFNGCMVDRYNATKPATVTTLNCTSNDVQLAVYELISGPTSCLIGETISVRLKGQFKATSAERWDVGVFVSTDGGTPNELGGSCYNDYLHPVSANNTDLNLTGGSGPFYNGEITEDPGDSCGDIEQGQDAFFITAEIDIVCQDSDGNEQADVNSCTVWANSRSDGDGKPSCKSHLDTTAETTAKCTCDSVEISGLKVLKEATIEVIKNLEPSTDSGKFDLQIDGATPPNGDDVGDGGTTGPVTVSAGDSENPGDTHTVGEVAGIGTNLGDYDSSIDCQCVNDPACSGDSATGAGPLELSVQPDDVWTCTITNTLRGGTLTLKKTVVNDDGGTASANAWTLHATGDGGFSGPGDIIDPPANTMATISRGVKANVAYTLSESGGPSGYSEGVWSCSGGGTQNGNQITLAPNDNVTCEIVNNDIAPTLTLVKTIVNDDGGTVTDPNAFNLRVDGVLVSDSAAPVHTRCPRMVWPVMRPGRGAVTARLTVRSRWRWTRMRSARSPTTTSRRRSPWSRRSSTTTVA
jgi:hypothetical protein